MPKKFFDIFPPETINPQKQGPEAELGENKEKKPSQLKNILIAGGVFVVLLGVFLYFKLPRLDLEVWPKTEVVSFNEKITIDKNANGIDLVGKIIPGQTIEEEKELWQEFAATGKAVDEKKAQGVIQTYNKYNPPTPITLREGTRFLSDSGKYFRSLKKIYIPAAQLKGGKITPTWVDVNVEALETGEDYNIGSAKFSIPGLAGTSYYYTVYGESKDPMSGGYKKELKKVTEEDIQKASVAVTDKIFENLENSLKSKISQESVLLDKAISKSIVEASSLVKAGAVVDKFNFQAKANGVAFIFKKSDLDNFVKEFIISKIPESKKLYEESLKINYTPESVSVKDGKIILNLDISAKIYTDTDKKELSNLIKGKSAKEISETIEKNFREEISRVKVGFWPFWVKKTPKNIEKIDVKLNLE